MASLKLVKESPIILTFWKNTDQLQTIFNPFFEKVCITDQNYLYRPSCHHCTGVVENYAKFVKNHAKFVENCVKFVKNHALYFAIFQVLGLSIFQVRTNHQNLDEALN